MLNVVGRVRMLVAQFDLSGLAAILKERLAQHHHPAANLTTR
jgi:hypothetical protein